MKHRIGEAIRPKAFAKGQSEINCAQHLASSTALANAGECIVVLALHIKMSLWEQWATHAGGNGCSGRWGQATPPGKQVEKLSQLFSTRNEHCTMWTRRTSEYYYSRKKDRNEQHTKIPIGHTWLLTRNAGNLLIDSCPVVILWHNTEHTTETVAEIQKLVDIGVPHCLENKQAALDDTPRAKTWDYWRRQDDRDQPVEHWWGWQEQREAPLSTIPNEVEQYRGIPRLTQLHHHSIACTQKVCHAKEFDYSTISPQRAG